MCMNVKYPVSQLPSSSKPDNNTDNTPNIGVDDVLGGSWRTRQGGKPHSPLTARVPGTGSFNDGPPQAA